TKHIRLKPVKNKIVREQLITENDLDILLRACIGNQRDKAFLHVHFEAGTRPGEILSLKIKHVKFDQYGAFIHVDGKTGARPIRLVRSVPDLAQWMDVHPFKDNPESPLWIILEQKRLGEPITYWTAERILNRIIERSKINKKINLKLFRHSEATNSAKYLTESQMRIRHGWTPTSHMPANYVHLVNSDVDQAYLKHLGIVSITEETPPIPKICHFCKYANSTTSEICNSCGKPLDVKAAIESDIQEDEKEMLKKILAKVVCKQDISNDEMKFLTRQSL
ncbi:MAG: site-specific integrase, partial [Thaumarchaeota archaeon]|nr:site-specific integrase [Nitrososphaerota archaeon]